MSYRVSVGLLSLLSVSGLCFSATTVDLSQEKIGFLKKLNAVASKSAMKTLSSSQDSFGTTHIRMKQTFSGIPVWGGDAIIHVPANKTKSLVDNNASSMTGTFYQNIKNDLSVPANFFTNSHAEKSVELAFNDFQNHFGKFTSAPQPKTELTVFIDSNNKAHWAYHVNFYLPSKNRPYKPNYLIDALNSEIYQYWDDVRSLENIQAGGYGGNLKTGKFTYDGKPGHLSLLDMQRDSKLGVCYLQNPNVSVTDYRTQKVVNFLCKNKTINPESGTLYWDGDADNIHGAYSPSNDALYAGKVILSMYKDWYGIPVLQKNSEPMKLEMVTHSPNITIYGPDPDNALWDPEEEKMYFGDGEVVFYPLTSVDVAAHEISHGFTSQHANLIYHGQSGAMDEAFSDMAAQAVGYYANQKNDWKIASSVMLTEDALRYLDHPKKDCEGRGNLPPAENCSIETMSDYYIYVKNHQQDRDPRTRLPEVHFSSGIYNRAFYVLANQDGWNTKKAFDVMVQANRFYWTPNNTFEQGACSVVKAAKDLNFDKEAVINAFNEVGIKLQNKTC